MIRRCCLLAGLAAGCVSAPAWSQPEPEKRLVWSNKEPDQRLFATIRRSATGEQVEKPAKISYTKPSDAGGSRTIDAALGLQYYLWDAGPSGTVGATAETHKNNAISKEQNKSIVGAASHLIVHLDDRRNWTVLPDFVFADEHDVRKHSRGVLTTASLRLRSKPWGIGDVLGPKWFPLWYEPAVGYQRSDVRKSDVGRGHVNRGTAAINASAYPLGYQKNKGWSLNYGLLFWSDFGETAKLDDGRDRHYYRSFGVAYHLNDNAAIGWSRISGENPVEGLAMQKYYQLTLEIKL